VGWSRCSVGGSSWAMQPSLSTRYPTEYAAWRPPCAHCRRPRGR